MIRLLLILLLWAPLVTAQEDDDWRRQSFRESKRLPDLHHVVDVKLAEGMRPPAGFALKDGRLACQTCHGLKEMDRIAYDKVDKDAPNFLRGGPYPELQAFCYNCHAKKEHERPNVHLLFDEHKRIKEENCLYCHEVVHKERDEPKAKSELKLRLPAEKLCFGCHLKTPHLNAVEHQDAKPKPEMKKHMEAKAREHKIILPLAEDGRVTCVSCHSPHPEGVMDKHNPAGAQVSGDVEKGIAYEQHPWDAVIKEDKRDRYQVLGMQAGEYYALGYQRIKTEVLLRLPAKDGTLCLSCHAFER